MPRRIASTPRAQRGSASVETIAVIPLLLLAGFAAAQLGLAGQALWSAAVAARAWARAALVGGDAARSARRALPAPMRAEVEASNGGEVAVRVTVPRVLSLPRTAVRAKTGLAGGDVR